jgi:large subunit ribosomal protein L4
MVMNKIVNFKIKTLNDVNKKEELINLTLNVPKYSNSLIFQKKSNYILHRALHTQLTNQRQGTRNTKTRAEVRGGGRKPWKQKGTGRARAGSNRSPLWKGGGVIFGPKPKNYCKKINRKEWRLSLRLLLLNKQQNITIIDNWSSDFLKTKEILRDMKELVNNPFDKIVIIVSQFNQNLNRVTKNLKNIKLLQANCLNIKDILTTHHIIIDKKSLKMIEEIYNND